MKEINGRHYEVEKSLCEAKKDISLMVMCCVPKYQLCQWRRCSLLFAGSNAVSVLFIFLLIQKLSVKLE